MNLKIFALSLNYKFVIEVFRMLTMMSMLNIENFYKAENLKRKKIDYSKICLVKQWSSFLPILPMMRIISIKILVLS